MFSKRRVNILGKTLHWQNGHSTKPTIPKIVIRRNGNSAKLSLGKTVLDKMLCSHIRVKYPLMLSMLGKNFSRHYEIFLPGNRFEHFMQVVSLEDNLH